MKQVKISPDETAPTLHPNCPMSTQVYSLSLKDGDNINVTRPNGDITDDDISITRDIILQKGVRGRIVGVQWIVEEVR